MVGLAQVTGLDFTSSRVYMGKASPPARAGLLSRVTQDNVTTFIFPQNPESDICVQVFIL